jgi:hypothetical protein
MRDGAEFDQEVEFAEEIDLDGERAGSGLRRARAAGRSSGPHVSGDDHAGRWRTAWRGPRGVAPPGRQVQRRACNLAPGLAASGGRTYSAWSSEAWRRNRPPVIPHARDCGVAPGSRVPHVRDGVADWPAASARSLPGRSPAQRHAVRTRCGSGAGGSLDQPDAAMRAKACRRGSRGNSIIPRLGLIIAGSVPSATRVPDI